MKPGAFRQKEVSMHLIDVRVSSKPRRHNRPLTLGVIAVFALVAVSCDSDRSPSNTALGTTGSPSTSPVAVASDYAPDINPDDFVATIDNPLLPLEPGSVFKLRVETEDEVEHETITVTDRTKEVMGVTTTVVRDVVSVRGGPVEFTYDWYAQDKEGNVWYFGEDTAEYADGKVVSRKGSWEAGVDGAQPGIIMNAHPQINDAYWQEYYVGEAEDMYWVVGTGESKSVPFGDFDNVVHTLEWTPLEPKIVVEKFYAPGVGLITEHALSGGKENVQLIDVIKP
jgi:hypothetical protein